MEYHSLQTTHSSKISVDGWLCVYVWQDPLVYWGMWYACIAKPDLSQCPLYFNQTPKLSLNSHIHWESTEEALSTLSQTRLEGMWSKCSGAKQNKLYAALGLAHPSQPSYMMSQPRAGCRWWKCSAFTTCLHSGIAMKKTCSPWSRAHLWCDHHITLLPHCRWVLKLVEHPSVHTIKPSSRTSQFLTLTTSSKPTSLVPYLLMLMRPPDCMPQRA